MTVGISIDNGKQAVLVTDSRVSVGGRQSDSFDKMEIFSYDFFHGAIYGTGSGNLLGYVTRHLHGKKANTLLEFMEKLRDPYVDQITRQERTEMAAREKEIETRALLIADKKEKDDFIRSARASAWNRLDQEAAETRTQFLSIGYQKDTNEIVKIAFDRSALVEVEIPHTAIGSGSDAAQFYLLNKLQGTNVRAFDLPLLTFFALNAYSLATLNQGVGGTPKIAVLNKDGVNVLDRKSTISLANLSGAYLAEVPRLTRERTREYFDQILQGKGNAQNLSRVLGIGKTALQEAYIPLSSWQERTNRAVMPTL